MRIRDSLNNVKLTGNHDSMTIYLYFPPTCKELFSSCRNRICNILYYYSNAPILYYYVRRFQVKPQGIYCSRIRSFFIFSSKQSHNCRCSNATLILFIVSRTFLRIEPDALTSKKENEVGSSVHRGVIHIYIYKELYYLQLTL